MTAIRKVDLTTAKKTDENTLFPALSLPNTGHAIFSPQGDDTHGASLFRTRKPVMSLHTTQAHEVQKIRHNDTSRCFAALTRRISATRHDSTASGLSTSVISCTLLCDSTTPPPPYPHHYYDYYYYNDYFEFFDI